MTGVDFHATFRKQIGDLKLTSYGGGSPRSLELVSGDREISLTIEECRDLRYSLDRFLERHGGEG